jgi:RimJ/RimL family protein N-acetyltransferase
LFFGVFSAFRGSNVFLFLKRRQQKRFRHFHLGRPWCEAIELEDGRQFILRPMQITDAPTLRKSFARLTPEEVRLRFLHPIKELTVAYSNRLASINTEREFALVVVENAHPDVALIGAVARASIDATGREAEFAIIVGQEIGKHGLGHHLLSKLVEWTRKKGLAAIYGHVLRDNRPMLKLARNLNFQIIETEDDDDIYLIRRAFNL